MNKMPPLEQRTVDLFRATVSKDFNYTEIIIKHAQHDLIMRLLVRYFVSLPSGDHTAILLGMGMRSGELAR